MKVLAVCAVFAALAAVFLMTNWGSDFEELDTCSKVQTVIFERILPLIAKNDKSYFSLSWERALYAHIGLRFNSMEYLFHKRLMDVEIVESHASNDGNSIPLRIYRKNQDEGIADGALRPILLWIHGGGCLLGEAKVDDNTCKKLVLLNDFLVINVDYRLAPEHIFPTAVHDVHAALQWIRRHGREYGGDISKVIISGESAGGYLTLAVTALYFSEDTKVKWKGSKLRIAALVPIYPSVDSSYIAKTMISNITAVLPPSHLQHFRNTYAGGRLKEASKNYLFTPKHTPEEILQQFPPTIMVVAKHDILAAEGIAFESKLKSLGVSTELLIYNHSIHNFYGRWYFSEGDLAMRDVAFHLRNFLYKTT
jgi:acetyl esterase